MAITLITETRTARVVKYGNDTVTVAAGKSLKVETSPGGEELLDEEVPTGKSWDVTVSVYIVETDA